MEEIYQLWVDKVILSPQEFEEEIAPINKGRYLIPNIRPLYCIPLFTPELSIFIFPYTYTCWGVPITQNRLTFRIVAEYLINNVKYIWLIYMENSKIWFIVRGERREYPM